MAKKITSGDLTSVIIGLMSLRNDFDKTHCHYDPVERDYFTLPGEEDQEIVGSVLDEAIKSLMDHSDQLDTREAGAIVRKSKARLAFSMHEGESDEDYFKEGDYDESPAL